MTRSTIWSAQREPGLDPPLRILPRGVCTNCRRYDYCPLRLPFACYWCNAGTFTHRSEWVFSWCPTCGGEDPFCKGCHGKRVVALPALAGQE